MAASFSLGTPGSDYINITVKPDSSYSAYRVFVRLASDSSNTTYDKWYSGISSTFSAYVDGLSSSTQYVVNVAYNTSATATGATWIGSQTFTTASATTTYYATLSFDANGGSGAPSKQYGSSTDGTGYVQFSIPSTTPTRSGYTFVGWATNTSGTGTIRYPGGTYTGYGTTSYPGPSHTLYAVWQAATYYVTLNFNANGGSGSPSSKTYTGTSQYISVTIPSTVPTKSGYTFLGWASSSTATEASWTAGATYSSWYASTDSSYSQTLYAVWQQTQYEVTIVYNANGGSGAPSSETYTGSSQSLTVTLSSVKPTKSGYVFAGWATTSTATTAQYSAGQTLSNVYAGNSGYTWTLYAVWTEEETDYVWIYDGGWKKYIPWVYDSGWTKVKPWVYDGAWKRGV